ncbi:MAG: AAA family ATPase [Candidatus Heimdallarchaeota archaeon]
MKSLVLTPVGYPLRAGEEATPFVLTTDDPTLFQHYAIQQWAGSVVRTGNFLFDSLLFPDYAFRAVTVEPDGSRISETTKISLSIDSTPVEAPISRSAAQVRFGDVVGQNQAKEKCQVIARFLNDESLISSPWVPRNVLFYGPPGCGKTMLARALSYETKHPMFMVKASELLGIYVGDGARKIQNLYTEARKKAPAIIFIDELDAIGLKRNYQSIRGDVVEIVSALLGEMDGITRNQGVVTIASTNEPSILDVAVLGRFEELIEFSRPSVNERADILRMNAASSPIPFIGISWIEIAQKTRDWSGRDLKERIIKNAIHGAILNGRTQITMQNVFDMMEKHKFTPEPLAHYG